MEPERAQSNLLANEKFATFRSILIPDIDVDLLACTSFRISSA